jgi:hypothetical protein
MSMSPPSSCPPYSGLQPEYCSKELLRSKEEGKESLQAGNWAITLS